MKLNSRWRIAWGSTERRHSPDPLWRDPSRTAVETATGLLGGAPGGRAGRSRARRRRAVTHAPGPWPEPDWRGCGSRRRRGELRTRWRRLAPGRQALLVLAHLRKGETYADLASGFAVGMTTVYRYIREGLTLLAALAPTLEQAIDIAGGRPT
jgi:hypothetical protein